MSSITQPYFDLRLELAPDSGLTETAHRNREALVDAYRKMTSGEDPQALEKLLDPQVSFHEAASLPYGCDETGPEGAARGVQGMFSAWSALKVTFTEFAAAGDLVICYMQLTGTSRATGAVYDNPNWEMFRFKDGKIVEWRPVYWDTHAVRQACGIS